MALDATRARVGRVFAEALLVAVVSANAAWMVHLWVHGANLHIHSTGDVAQQRRADHRPARGLSGAPAGADARSPPVARSADRVRPDDDLASPQRQGVHRPDRRPHDHDHRRLHAHRPSRARQGDLLAAGDLSGHGHRHGRHRPAHRGRAHVIDDHPSPPALRGLARRSHARLRRDRLGIPASGPDRQRADRRCWSAALLAPAQHRAARSRGPLSPARPAGAGVVASAAG